MDEMTLSESMWISDFWANILNLVTNGVIWWNNIHGDMLVAGFPNLYKDVKYNTYGSIES